MAVNARALIVEDDEEVLAMTRDLLEDSGFVVTGAVTRTEALAHLHREPFEVVVTDFLLDSNDPTVSWRGVQALRAAAGPTPLGVVTGSQRMLDKVADGELAFVLEKPFTFNRLIGELAGCLALPALAPAQDAALRAYFTSIERSDWDRLAQLCTPDVVYHLPGGDPLVGGPVRGRDAFVAFTREVFSQFVEPRFVIHEIRPLPRGALVRYEGSWQDARGRRDALPGGVLFRLEGDAITEIGVRLDASALIVPRAARTTR